jgi:hypothetical protein
MQPIMAQQVVLQNLVMLLLVAEKVEWEPRREPQDSTKEQQVLLVVALVIILNSQ